MLDKFSEQENDIAIGNNNYRIRKDVFSEKCISYIISLGLKDV